MYGREYVQEQSLEVICSWHLIRIRVYPFQLQSYGCLDTLPNIAWTIPLFQKLAVQDIKESESRRRRHYKCMDGRHQLVHFNPETSGFSIITNPWCTEDKSLLFTRCDLNCSLIVRFKHLHDTDVRSTGLYFLAFFTEPVLFIVVIISANPPEVLQALRTLCRAPLTCLQTIGFWY